MAPKRKKALKKLKKVVSKSVSSARQNINIRINNQSRSRRSPANPNMLRQMFPRATGVQQVQISYPPPPMGAGYNPMFAVAPPTGVVQPSSALEAQPIPPREPTPGRVADAAQNRIPIPPPPPPPVGTSRPPPAPNRATSSATPAAPKIDLREQLRTELKEVIASRNARKERTADPELAKAFRDIMKPKPKPPVLVTVPAVVYPNPAGDPPPPEPSESSSAGSSPVSSVRGRIDSNASTPSFISFPSPVEGPSGSVTPSRTLESQLSRISTDTQAQQDHTSRLFSAASGREIVERRGNTLITTQPPGPPGRPSKTIAEAPF